MQYAKITARVALMVADSTDSDENPDEVYATGGQVVLSPLVKRVQGVGLFRLPQPITADIDAQGYLSLNANREVLILDLGDPTLNPSVPRNQGAWKVEFKNVKFGTTALAIDSFFINPDAADNDVPSGQVDGSGNPVQKNDLSILAPIPTGSAGAGITRGPAGPAGEGVPDTSTAVDGQVVTYTSGGIVWATPTGGGTALTSYANQVAALPDYPDAFTPDLTGVTPGDIGAEPAGDYATNTALTNGLAGKVPTSRTVAGKPLSANVTLASGDVTDFATAVDARVQNVVGAAPAALDTLAELATALGDDANFAGTVTTALATKYVKPGTGIPSTDMTTAVQTSLGKADAALPASGTAAAATKLATARTINGQSFDGTANVVIGANNITTGQMPMAQATPGARFTVLSTAGGWPARPSARTDIFFDWIDMNGLGTNPPGWLDGDSVLKAA